MKRIIANETEKVPNTEYLELNFVGETATGRGNNTQLIMENLHNGEFQVTDGRVGITIGRHKPKMYKLPMEQWDSFYFGKVNRGYLLTKTEKMESKVITKQGFTVNGQQYKTIDNADVNQIITDLLSYANAVIATNYTVKLASISKEMITFGNNILDELATNFEEMSVAEFNNKLKVLYAAIPRRIDNLSKALAQRKVQFNDIISNEQDLFDILSNQVKSEQNQSTEKTVLDVYGLQWESVTPEEKASIIKRLGAEGGRYINAWRITNNKTQKAFDEYCKQENLTHEHGISRLFHGSRNENFWSIVTNGLTINPVGVTITGKMFGNGTYFAPSASKSVGYTSRYGAKWTNGTQDCGFLALYDVATGVEYHPTSSNSGLNYKKLQEICPGAHCTWAKGNTAGLLNDEVIVYQDQQSTIKYLIQIGM